MTIKNLKKDDIVKVNKDMGWTEEFIGKFIWDDDIGEFETRLPAVVIDGKTYSWIELGTMLECYEGWKFKLNIIDPSENI